MNLPTIFNIAIGLVFIYLVLSLLASQIQEVIATILEWRAEQLTRAIENLVLGDTDLESEINNRKTYNLVDNLFRNPLIRNLNQTSKSWIATISKNFIPQNKEPNRNTINPPYIPAETFSSTVLSELDIPQAARVLTWLNAKRLIHYEIYDKIDELLESNESVKPKEKIIRPHYNELKNCLKAVLDDYKMERYGLSSTLIRLRTHIETFKREIENEKCFAITEISLSEGLSEGSTSTQTTKSPKNPIDKIIDFIFTPDKNDDDLVARLRPKLTTILDLLIPPDTLDPANQTVSFIFTPEGSNRDLDICSRSSLTKFLDLLRAPNTSKIKPRKHITVNQIDQIIDFIFQLSENKYELEMSYREEFFKLLNCLASPDTSKNDKLTAYKRLKAELKNARSKNANELYKSFIEVEKYFIPLAYQSFQTDLRKSEEAKLKKSEIEDLSEEAKLKKSEVEDLYESFTYVQKYLNNISSRLPESLRKSLYELAVRSRIKASDIENQLDNFKQEIETWFDRSMDRASGVYKRNTRGFAFLIGFVLAFALNADTFYIVSRLLKDDALRNSIVSTSTQLVQDVQSPNPSPTAIQSPSAKSSSSAKPSPPAKPSPTPTVSPIPTPTLSPNTIERIKDNVDQSLSDLSLPIGWTDNILDEQLQRPALDKDGETAEQKQNREIQNEKRKTEQAPRRARIFGWYVPLELIMIMGWLVTATAIMMGAPFWFDFLGLFINVRNTGSRPAPQTDKK